MSGLNSQFGQARPDLARPLGEERQQQSVRVSGKMIFPRSMRAYELITVATETPLRKDE
jgi:hypothetical protein